MFHFPLIILTSLLVKYTQHSTLSNIIPNTPLRLSNLHLNEEQLFIIPINALKPNSFYKIMVHYLGSLGINFKINLICDDIHHIKTYTNQNIKLNDFNEYDFHTNEHSFPTICGDSKDVYDKILLSIEPFSITYQLKDEKEMNIQAVVEVVKNVVNTDVKFVNILTNKGLYKGMIIALIICPLVVYLFRDKIRKALIILLDEKVVKSK